MLHLHQETQMTVRLLAFSGSSRRESINQRLLNVAVASARAAGAEVTELHLAQDLLPLYDGDLEDRGGLPAAARTLKEQFAQHDGFLIASPEYNGFFSPLLKNTIDWVSRPLTGAPAPFAGKTAALFAASAGGLGGIRGLPHLRLLLSNLGVTVTPAQLALGRAEEAYGADGRLADAGQQAMLDKCVAELLNLTRAMKQDRG
jgi:NAD(P)H-dependent FMN reductase